MSVPVYVALLHFPITNRNGELVTTAVTNMDIHDIARSAKTFGASGYFIVTPIEDQHELVGRILKHWHSEQSRQYHPDRYDAVSLVRLARSFDEVKAAIRAAHGEDPEVVLTDARDLTARGLPQLAYAEYRREIEAPGRTRPVLVVFGTGWGIADVFYPQVHRVLAPVYGREGKGGYNHLSVRAAAAIILDRLFGN